VAKRYISILVLLLSAAVSACSGDNNDQVVSPSENGQNIAPTARLPITFKVGDVIQLENHTVTLNSATVDSANVLKANLTIENQGKEELNIDSISLFEARSDDGNSLDREYSDCGPGLDSSVLPGDKLRGDICWSAGTLGGIWTLHYKVSFSDRNAVIWGIAE
jgi:hypothetical protein